MVPLEVAFSGIIAVIVSACNTALDLVKDEYTFGPGEEYDYSITKSPGHLLNHLDINFTKSPGHLLNHLDIT